MNAIQSHAQNSFENAFQLASTRVPRLPPQCSAGEALQAMAGHSYDCANHLVVCDDEERLLGGIEEPGEFAHVGLAGDPIVRLKVEELIALDDEDRGAVCKRQRRRFEGFEQYFRIFKAGL